MPTNAIDQLHTEIETQVIEVFRCVTSIGPSQQEGTIRRIPAMNLSTYS